MTEQTLRDIVESLHAARSPGSFATRGTLAPEHLVLTVDGVGRLASPVPPEQAERLCALARPAHFGRGEQTLLDPAVRDTWQVPLERVAIDEQRWHAALAPILEAVRGELGLPRECALRAEPHSMLVYEPGQFFLRHRDSEKADGMIGTLVVTLPTALTGGELVVEHRGEQLRDGGAPGALGYVAFYADCEHEVLPVTAGHRISLTYNLIAAGGVHRAAGGPDAAALAALLRTHFGTPVPVPYWRRGDGPEERPPQRLVYLLDHQYSRRGLGWDRLKGADAASAAALLAAAGAGGFEAALALAEVEQYHRTDAFEDEYWMVGRRRRWEFTDGTWVLVDDAWEPIDGDEDEEDDFTEPGDRTAGDHPDVNGELGEPDSTRVVLQWWLGGTGTGKEIEEQVSDDEVCCRTPTSALQAHAYEAEGYTGNDGDTIERWYRRAAIVVYPQTVA